MDQPNPSDVGRVALADLDRFCREALAAVGVDAPTAEAATRAMMHGTRLGIDSHGVRLLGHYLTVLAAGRVNPRPSPRLLRLMGATATLDGDHGHGARSAYFAMDHAVDLAAEYGIGAVAIRNSSHFGPAGAYAVPAAAAGMIGVVTCNSDSFVRLHDGAARFHGTNPFACAVPMDDEHPWLLDMATSSVPYNRILLYRSLGRSMPPGTASTADGLDTSNPEETEMLAPLGGAFGFKGAGFAGFVEILSAVLTGMKLSFDILPMAGPDLSTPRQMGAFVMAIRPDAFVEPEVFAEGMRRYVETLRASPARPDHAVMAPGDREWAEAARRDRLGVPIDPETSNEFAEIAKRYGLSPLSAKTVP
ncbi:Ldh family oxidoreductase [Consotaella aegiceratis]|uniref:Ldh family oxidoreductase n=1 Tax=Consotaella aegiceratis TaxID=3097961 RepID=UPI002F42FBC9